ncbi:MAG: beta strand repeat-containing protein, partial [Prochlorotrichaceae cyanobacterium]
EISTAVGATGEGNAGAIVLNSNNLTLTEASSITSSTAGQGSAGSISVTGNGEIRLDSSTISTAIEPTGVANPTLPPSSITLRTGSVTLQNGATITSETKGDKNPLGQGGTGDAGTIAITAQTGDITLTGASSILSAVGVNSIGNAGGMKLEATGDISLLDGSLLTASTRGQGNSGAIEIKADNFLAQGEDTAGFGSAIFSTVGTSAQGNSGGIKLVAQNTVSLLSGAVLDATTYGQGDSGAIEITAQDVYLQGEDSAGFLSGILSTVEETGVGNSGGINLKVGGNVWVSDGARLDVSTSGRGNSGAIDISAQQVWIQGESRFGDYNSNVLSKVEATGIGNSGGVSIRASESLSLLAGGVIATTTFGQGNSGAIDIVTPNLLIQGAVSSEIDVNLDNVQGAGISNIQSAVADTGRGNSGTITVNAQRISLLDGGQLNANTFGQGNSGLIDITTQDLLAQGASLSGTYKSGIQSGVGNTGIGNSQGINIKATGTVSFLDGALLSASTQGTASDRSNITLSAPTLNLDNQASITASTTGFRDPGFNNAGKIEITTANTTLSGGSTIQTNTAGSGAGGEIILIATEGLFIKDDGSGIFSNTEENSTGNAGSIFIDPPIVDIRDGAGISVNSLGAGTGGNITLAAGDLTLDNNAFISASTVNSNGGQIFLTIGGNLLLLNNSYLSAAAGLGQAAGGDGGSITIDAASILGFNNADISANAGLGRGGNITINTPILLGFLVKNVPDTSSDPRNNISASGQASAGTITINNSVDPSKGLDPLAANLADLASRVRQACDISSAQTLNQFRIAGRGGLPSTPQDPLQSQGTLEDLRLLDDWLAENGSGDETIASPPRESPPLSPRLSEAGEWEWISPQALRLVTAQGNATVNFGTGTFTCNSPPQ